MTSNLKSPILRWMSRLGSRLDVASLLIFVALSLAALGSCFPQVSPPVAADAERLEQWEAGVRAKYGALTDLLSASGAFRWFSSPLFWVPPALLAVTTLVCTLDRWQAIWRQALHRPARCSDLALDSAPHTARLTMPPPLAGGAEEGVVRERLERRGFQVQVSAAASDAPTDDQTSDQTIYLRGDRNRLAPLATLVTHLAALLLLLGAALSSRYGWREEVTIRSGETVEIGRGGGLALRNDGFTVIRYPDGNVAGYEATVTVVGERGAMHGSIRVNEPLTYGSVGLYLRGYEGAAGRYNLALLVVHDPGYGPVIAAGLLLLLGLTVSFNFPHCWIWARIEPEGVLRLTGRADRWACDFGREFTALVEEIEQAANVTR